MILASMPAPGVDRLFIAGDSVVIGDFYGRGMMNSEPPPLAALHEPWGWVKRVLVLVFVGVLAAGLEVKYLFVGRAGRRGDRTHMMG